MSRRLTIDRAAHQVLLDGEFVDLTPTEYQLMDYLHERTGVAVPDHELLHHVWGPEWSTDIGVQQVQMSRLRQKLRVRNLSPLTRVRGFGYRFDFEATGTADIVEWDVELTYDSKLVLSSVRPYLPFLGWQPDEVIGTPFMLAGSRHQEAMRQVQDMIRAGDLTIQVFFTSFSAEGAAVATEAAIQIHLDESGALNGMLSQARFYLRRPSEH
jgi:DNA-binding winged helix-turn-helix (wHTH) protein